MTSQARLTYKNLEFQIINDTMCPPLIHKVPPTNSRGKVKQKMD